MKKLLKQPYTWLLILSVVYFATRLFNLTSLPIFTDEAIYIRWAQIGTRDASWRFISLTDGKQPLFTWLMMATIRLFQDPLYAGRFASVLAGFLGMIGMYATGAELFKSKRAGLFASALYLISPFFLMYDRMALYDSLVAACSVWNLYLAILLVRYVRLDVALIFGLTLGVGMLNKTSGFMSLYFVPFTLLLFDWTGKHSWKRLATWIGFVLIAAILSQIVYSILRLSPYFYIVAQKDTIFIYPLSEWLVHPWQFFQGNIHGLFSWLRDYMTWPLFLAALASIAVFWKQPRAKMLLLLWWIAPFTALALFGRVLYPRFILFMTIPLYLLAAWLFAYITQARTKQLLAWGAVILFSIPSMYLSFRILMDIKHAPITISDRGQYINDWPSGWGVKEIVSFFQQEAEKNHISIYTEGTFGLFPYALEIYLADNPNVDIHGIWPFPREMPLEIASSSAKNPTYVIMKQSQSDPAWNVLKLSEYPQGTNANSTLRVYQIVPQKEE